MLTRRRFLKLALSSILLQSFGCTLNQKHHFIPGTLRLNLGYEPDTLDWLRATDSYSFDVISNIMCGLTKYNSDFESVPSIAEKWNISNDGKTYTFYLNQDFKWTDGKPVLAEDFYFAWEKLLNPKTGGQYAYLFYPIKNAYEYNTGIITDPKELGIKAVDDYIFEVELKKPIAFFLNLTSYCFSFPQRKDIIERHGDDWTEPGKIVTCGPFYLDTWNHEYKITLKRNEYYKNPKPLLDEIKYYIVQEQSSGFSLYLNNEIDWIDSRSIPISEIETAKKLKETQFKPLLRVVYIGFNVTKYPFNNPLVRKALSHSIDRSIFPKVLRRGEVPTSSLIPPQLKDFYNPRIGCEFNPELAKKLLTRAGFENGKNFPPVHILFPTRDDIKLYLEVVQAQWKKILNINISLKNEEWKVYLNTLHRDAPPIYRLSWGADYPDPDTFLNLFTSNSGNNYGRWKNKIYDSLVSSGASEMDIKRRKEIYRNAQKILLEDEAAISPLFFNTQVILGKPWVKNLEFNAMDLIFCEKIKVG